MVALGWMDLLWMGLFAGIIFGEKMWSKGIWVARAAGAILAVVGILTIAGLIPSFVPSSVEAPMTNNSSSSSSSNSNSGTTEHQLPTAAENPAAMSSGPASPGNDGGAQSSMNMK